MVDNNEISLAAQRSRLLGGQFDIRALEAATGVTPTQFHNWLKHGWITDNRATKQRGKAREFSLDEIMMIGVMAALVDFDKSVSDRYAYAANVATWKLYKSFMDAEPVEELFLLVQAGNPRIATGAIEIDPEKGIALVLPLRPVLNKILHRLDEFKGGKK